MAIKAQGGWFVHYLFKAGSNQTLLFETHHNLQGKAKGQAGLQEAQQGSQELPVKQEHAMSEEPDMNTEEAIEWFDSAVIEFEHKPHCSLNLICMSQLGNEIEKFNKHQLFCPTCNATSPVFPGVLMGRDYWDVWFEVNDRMNGRISFSA